MEATLQFNPDVFRLARGYRGKTQAELSAATGISQGMLSKFDHGLKIPDAAQIQRIASALDFPVSFFKRQWADIPSGMVFHRKRMALKERDRAMIENEAKLRLHCIKLLLQELEVDQNFKKMDLADFGGSPARVAEALRFAWKIPSGPIKDLFSIVENNGIIIIHFDFQNNTLDGFFMNDGCPCIVINSGFPMDRQRFTLCHELGHLIMHDYPSDDIEKEANQFASEFLMPTQDIKKYFARQRVDLRFLISLKPLWRVSIAALLHRAKDLGYISDSNYRRIIIQMNSLQIRKNEPEQISLEIPTLVDEIVHTYRDELKYTEHDLQEVMAISSSDYARFFPSKEESLRNGFKLIDRTASPEK